MEDQLFYKNPFNQIGHKMKLLVDTGRLLMETGANTNHLIRDVKRVAVFMGMKEEEVHVHVTHNTIMVAITTDDRSYTSFTKAATHGVDMTKLSALRKLTWRALEEEYSLEKYEAELCRIENIREHYPLLLRIFSAGMACGGFTLLFGGDWLAALVTLVCATIAYATRRICTAFKINAFISIAVAAFVATALGALSYVVTNDAESMTYAMISASLFLVPGVPLMNAVDDLLNGFTVSGSGRAVFTLLIVGFMTFGIVGAITVEPQASMSNLAILPTELSWLQILAGGISALGFSTLFNTPVRLLPYITAGGAIALGVRNYLLVDAHIGLVGSSLIASVVIAFIMMKMAKWGNTSVSVLAIPSVIPMIPGVLLYRFAFAIMQINHMNEQGFLQAEQAGFTGIITIFCMTIGVATPALLFNGLLMKEKTSRLKALVEKRNH